VYKQILAISLLIAPFAAAAQTADDYFHRGAQFYIHGDKPKAKAEIETGLTKYPNDAQLQQHARAWKRKQRNGSLKTKALTKINVASHFCLAVRSAEKIKRSERSTAPTYAAGSNT